MERLNQSFSQFNFFLIFHLNIYFRKNFRSAFYVYLVSNSLRLALLRVRSSSLPFRRSPGPTRRRGKCKLAHLLGLKAAHALVAAAYRLAPPPLPGFRFPVFSRGFTFRNAERDDATRRLSRVVARPQPTSGPRLLLQSVGLALEGRNVASFASVQGYCSAIFPSFMPGPTDLRVGESMA